MARRLSACWLGTSGWRCGSVCRPWCSRQEHPLETSLWPKDQDPFVVKERLAWQKKTPCAWLLCKVNKRCTSWRMSFMWDVVQSWGITFSEASIAMTMRICWLIIVSPNSCQTMFRLIFMCGCSSPQLPDHGGLLEKCPLLLVNLDLVTGELFQCLVATTLTHASSVMCTQGNMRTWDPGGQRLDCFGDPPENPLPRKHRELEHRMPTQFTSWQWMFKWVSSFLLLATRTLIDQSTFAVGQVSESSRFPKTWSFTFMCSSCRQFKHAWLPRALFHCCANTTVVQPKSEPAWLWQIASWLCNHSSWHLSTIACNPNSQNDSRLLCSRRFESAPWPIGWHRCVSCHCWPRPCDMLCWRAIRLHFPFSLRSSLQSPLEVVKIMSHVGCSTGMFFSLAMSWKSLTCQECQCWNDQIIGNTHDLVGHLAMSMRTTVLNLHEHSLQPSSSQCLQRWNGLVHWKGWPHPDGSWPSPGCFSEVSVNPTIRSCCHLLLAGLECQQFGKNCSCSTVKMKVTKCQIRWRNCQLSVPQCCQNQIWWCKESDTSQMTQDDNHFVICASLRHAAQFDSVPLSSCFLCDFMGWEAMSKWLLACSCLTLLLFFLAPSGCSFSLTFCFAWFLCFSLWSRVPPVANALQQEFLQMNETRAPQHFSVSSNSVLCSSEGKKKSGQNCPFLVAEQSKDWSCQSFSKSCVPLFSSASACDKQCKQTTP